MGLFSRISLQYRITLLLGLTVTVAVGVFVYFEQAGHIRVGKGECKAVAVVTDAVHPGVVFVNFLWAGSPVNSLAHRVPDPITNRYRFKLGKGRIEKIGESPYKRSFDEMTFAPRPVA